FNARGLPWPDVFTWLTKETGKPVISNYKVNGTFTVHVPENAEYTLAETIDLINEALLEQNYVLLQREKTFTVWPADKKLPSDYIRRVGVEKLANLRKTEVVEIVVTLKALDAEKFQGTVKRMLGVNFGEVVAIEGVNQLVIQETVNRLEQVLRTIED